MSALPATPSLSKSTEEIYTEQNFRLKEQNQLKKEQIEKLKEVSQLLVFCSGELNQATLKTQALLKKVPSQLQPSDNTFQNYPDPLQQLDTIFSMAAQAEKGKILENFSKPISDLNQQVGQLNFATKKLEEETSQINESIAKAEKLIQEKNRFLAELRKTRNLLNKQQEF